jgi:precorrin-3B synthase
MDPGRAASSPVADDRCPGLIRLHPAGDGDLARVRLPGGRLTAAQLSAVARAARLGNGIVDLTSRANLQLRGVRDATAVVAELQAVGLLPSPPHDRVRNIIASPFAGRHPRSLYPTDAIVAALDHGLCADANLARLPGRFLIAVDDGSRTVDCSRADVWLRALPGGSFRVNGRLVPADAAAEVALEVAREWLDSRGRGPAIAPAPAPATSHEPRLGRLRQADGRLAVTVMAPLGRLDPPLLERLAAAAGCEVRLSTRRTITLLDLVDAPDTTGFVTSEDSGWWGLSACSGSACASSRADVRAVAADRARRRGPGAPTEHWSGCERRCGRPADVDIEHVA